MAELIWSPQAFQDLDEIAAFIDRASPRYAQTLVQQVFALAATIPTQPRLGAEVPEFERDDIRERLVQNFRVIYRLRGEDVEIITVIHGARQLPTNPPA
jgi:toxin ParE1/3/4